jgi:hypothetical protein
VARASRPDSCTSTTTTWSGNAGASRRVRGRARRTSARCCRLPLVWWSASGSRVGALPSAVRCVVAVSRVLGAARLARSCDVGGRVRQVVCPVGGSGCTFAGSPLGNLRFGRRPRFAVGWQRCRCFSESGIVRLSVTPLGASGKSVSGVAGAVVDYLEGSPSKRGVPLIGGPVGVGSYYAGSIEGPGRWLDAGAEFRSLSGTVDRDSFQRVLEGRHPATGERLVTARGSSQRSHLAVGTPARVDQEGNPMYTPSDVAKLLGVSLKEVTELVRSGLGGMCDPDDVGWIGSTSDDAGGS